MARIPFQTKMRQAAVEYLTDYAQDANVKLQVYPARPRSIYPPTAFVDNIREVITFSPGLRRRVVTVTIRVVWGLFDSKEAADQRDVFVDDFIDWVTDRPHQADASTMIGPGTIQDDPTFIPEWLPLDQQQTPYFSTLIEVEGEAGGF